MNFWRPGHELRGAHGYWFTNPRLMQYEMSELAAKAIYRVFNLFPVHAVAANDRDHLRW